MNKNYQIYLCFFLVISGLVHPVYSQSNYAGDSYDVDKYYFSEDNYPTYRDPEDTSDIYMCWAATTANILAYSGFARTPVPEEEGKDTPIHYQIYHDLLSMVPNTGAFVDFGLTMYLNRFYPDLRASEYVREGRIGYQTFEKYLLEGKPTGLCIIFWNEDHHQLTNGHAITCWAYNLVFEGDDFYEEGDIYDLFVSDSDDYAVWGNPFPATLQQLHDNKNIKKMRIALIDGYYWIRKINHPDYRSLNAPASSIWITTTIKPLEEDVLPYFYKLQDKTIPRTEITLSIMDDDGERIEYNGKKYYYNTIEQTGFQLEAAPIIKNTPSEFSLFGTKMVGTINEKYFDGELKATKIIQGDSKYLYYGENDSYQLQPITDLVRVYRSKIEPIYEGDYYAELDEYFIENPEYPRIDSNIPPFAKIKIQVQANEITLDASESYDVFNDPLSYRWDFENDGIWDTDWSFNPYIIGTWENECIYSVAVEVTDGTYFDTAETLIDLNNLTINNEDKIVFTSYRDSNAEIYVMEPDGSGLTRLTNNIYIDEQPCWSPDGQKIVYQSDRDGNMELYVMNADGTGQTRLTTNHADDLDGGWSPDGKKIVFTSKRDGNYELYVMNSNGSGQTRLTNNYASDVEACWSSDCSKIVFASDRDNDFEIFIMNSDGSEQRQLTSNYASDGDPHWSPNGSKIVFNTDRYSNFEIYSINVDGSEEKQLTFNNDLDGQPFWSPDGTKIVFTSDRDGVYDIFVMNHDGTNQTNLTNDDGYDYGASWVRKACMQDRALAIVTEPRINGKIVFQSDRDGNYEIYTMNWDGSEQTRLTYNNYRDHWPSWSPDGKKIVYSNNGDGNAEIYIMNSDGSEQTRLTNDNSEDIQPSWSPDGTKIAFTSDRNDNQEIYIMNSDGSELTRLTNNYDDDDLPRWSPDGSKIAFESERDGHWEIYTMNSDGSDQTRLTYNQDENPSWSPDGTKIVFATSRDGNEEVYIMNADGSDQKRLIGSDKRDYLPFWSPDGTKIAFISTRDGDNEICVMNVDGSEQTKLTNNLYSDYFPSWQSLSRLNSTINLQSSTSTSLLNTPFNLEASLSTPLSGAITLFWSINNSGFIYQHEEALTNGLFSRSFRASSPGTWAFKVEWEGDKEHKGTESNIVTVVVKPLPILKAEISATPSTIYSGGTSKIRIYLTSEGTTVIGATITLTSGNDGIFSATSDQGNGTYLATYTAPVIDTQTMSIVSVTTSKSGYQDVTGQIQLTLQPLAISTIIKESNGAPISGVEVTSSSQPSGQSVLSGTTDSNGQVKFNNMLIGDYTFMVTKSGYESKVVDLSLVAGETKNVNISLDRTPAEFRIWNASIPTSNLMGETLYVKLNIQNIGGTAGSYETNMTIGSSTFIDGESEVLEPGEFGSIFYEYTFTSAGSFTVQVGGLSNQVIVSEPEPKPDKPGGIPGYPIESMVLSILLVSMLIWMMRKKN